MIFSVTAAHARMVCAACHALFTPARADALFCSGRCRTAAWRHHRKPGPWACVVWVRNPRADRDLRSSWSYHLTRADAVRAAPTTGAPFSEVNIRKPPWRHWTRTDALLRGRWLDTPAPDRDAMRRWPKRDGP